LAGASSSFAGAASAAAATAFLTSLSAYLPFLASGFGAGGFDRIAGTILSSVVVLNHVPSTGS